MTFREQHKIAVKLTRWFIFSVCFALLPFGINWWHLYTSASSSRIYWYELWPRGELLLVSAAVAADAVGELIGGQNRGFPIRKLLAGGTCALCPFVGAAWFSQLQFAPITAPPPTFRIGWRIQGFSQLQFAPITAPAKISRASVIIFGLTIVAGGGCKILAELKP